MRIGVKRVGEELEGDITEGRGKGGGIREQEAGREERSRGGDRNQEGGGGREEER